MKKIILLSILTSFYVMQSACAWFPSAKEPAYTLIKTWGDKGAEFGQFNEPTGIAVFQNEVFVSDSRNGRIQVFDLDGRFKKQFGTSGNGQSKLARPMNLSIAQGKLYVADYFKDSILVYSLKGEYLHRIGLSGDQPGQFNAPGGVAVDQSGQIYVADFHNQRVQKLTSDGTFIRQWGSTGKAGTFAGKLSYPTAVAVNDKGWLYIADGYNDRVLLMDVSGELKTKWGGPFAMNIYGSFNGWFTTVTGITIGPKGNVFVADFYNNRVQKFTAEGDFLTCFGIESDTPTHTAIAVSVAQDGSVFVADYANHQVQKWQQNE